MLIACPPVAVALLPVQVPDTGPKTANGQCINVGQVDKEQRFQSSIVTKRCALLAEVVMRLDKLEVYSINTVMLVRAAIAILAALQPAVAGAAPERMAERIVPFELAGNHIYVAAKFEGSSVSLMLDSGATRTFAALSDCTAQSVPRLGRLDLSGLAVADQAVNCFGKPDGSFDGHRFDGVLGDDFIRRFAIEIDYTKRLLIFRDPEFKPTSANGIRLPMELIEDDSGGRVPIVKAEFQGDDGTWHVGRFILDTGARTNFTLGDRFARQIGLTTAKGPFIRALVGGGVLVRKATMVVRRVPAVRLGSMTFGSPAITISEDREGILAAPEFDGIIGGELLQRFRVHLNYAAAEAILIPNAGASARFDYETCGMFVAGEGADFRLLRVKDVVPSSPASRAGLQIGDQIVAFGNRFGLRLTLESLRSICRGEGRINIRYLRGAKQESARLERRHLI